MSLLLTVRASGNSPAATLPAFAIDKRSAVIGRAAECDLVLPDPQNRISRQHCRIDFDGSAYVLTDISTSGTMVNGRRLNGSYRLSEGDQLSIGDYQLGVSMNPSAAPAPAWASPPRTTAAQRPGATAFPTVPSGATDVVSQLLAAAGLARTAVPIADEAVLAASGALLRHLVAGVAGLGAARTRAHRELGITPPPAQAANVLLAETVAATPLADLLRAGPAVAVPQAIEAVALVEAHQRAMLSAMQGALARTLESIAPAAIRQRTSGNDAALWKAYEQAFAGVADQRGFIDLFAKEFAAAYEQLANSPGK